VKSCLFISLFQICFAEWTKDLDPLENCVMMPDLRKTRGFRLANRLVGLDLAHAKLVIVAQAQVHALSWAYKMVEDLPDLATKFPFLVNGTFMDNLDQVVIKGLIDSNFGTFRSAVEQTVNEKLRAELLSSLDGFWAKALDVGTLFFADSKSVLDPVTVTKDSILRIPGRTKVNEGTSDIYSGHMSKVQNVKM
jgi:hypothetical protein